MYCGNRVFLKNHFEQKKTIRQAIFLSPVSASCRLAPHKKSYEMFQGARSVASWCPRPGIESHAEAVEVQIGPDSAPSSQKRAQIHHQSLTRHYVTRPASLGQSSNGTACEEECVSVFFSSKLANATRPVQQRARYHR